jgi:hypothetical protein
MNINLFRVFIATVMVSAVSLAALAQLPDVNQRREIPGVRPRPDIGIPDLVSSITNTGMPVVAQDGSVQMHVTVLVRNQGPGGVGKFKVSAQYKRIGFDAPFVAPFAVRGQQDAWYPWVSSLGAGKWVILAGTLTFDPAARGERVVVRLIADSCEGDGGMPDHCRVRESDERNNISAPKSIELP